MEGAWRANRKAESQGRILYRCTLASSRAIPVELADHPASLYVRQDAILGPLDDWIASLVTPRALADSREDDPSVTQAGTLHAELAEVDRKIAALISALEAGVAVTQISEQLKRRTKERQGIEARLRQASSSQRVTKEQMQVALEELGGVARLLSAADTSVRAKVYNSLGVRLDYDHIEKRVTASAEQACVFNRVRRGT